VIPNRKVLESPKHCHFTGNGSSEIACSHPFSKGASIRIKIRTKSEFFPADATVKHSSQGLGMGLMFHTVSSPFLIVLREWLREPVKIPHETNISV